MSYYVVLCYLRPRTTCRTMRLQNQNHITVILICVEMGGATTETSHGDILLSTYDNRLYRGHQRKVTVSHTALIV